MAFSELPTIETGTAFRRGIIDQNAMPRTRTIDNRRSQLVAPPATAEQKEQHLEQIRDRWRKAVRAAYPYGDESMWREQAAWAPTWDEVAADFTDGLFDEIREARALEDIVSHMRRRLEIAFVNDTQDTEAIAFVRRLRRNADEAFGVPRSPRKRRRYHLMRFVDLCVADGRKKWPDFAALARGEPDEAPAVDENGWVHVRSLGWLLAEWLVLVGDVSNIPKPELDELVAAWGEKRPGAKMSGGGRVGAYATLERFLRRHWHDHTRASQLKKEWQQADPTVKSKRSR